MAIYSIAYRRQHIREHLIRTNYKKIILLTFDYYWLKQACEAAHFGQRIDTYNRLDQLFHGLCHERYN